MKIMEGITPLPWRVISYGGPSIVGSDNGPIAEMDIALRDVTEVASNSVYIAHACNLFPELVEALEYCRDYFEERMDADQPAGSMPIPNEAMKMHMEVLDVLARAKGGSK